MRGQGKEAGILLNQMQLQDKQAFALRSAAKQASRQAGCDDFHTRINQSNGSSRNGKGMGQSMGDGIWNSAAGLP